MKNAKRILALAAAILLFWYVSQYINICPDRESAFHRPSLGLYRMYVVLPVLLYGYMLVFKLTRHNTPSDDSADSFHSHSSNDVSKLSQSHDQASDDTI